MLEHHDHLSLSLSLSLSHCNNYLGAGAVILSLSDAGRGDEACQRAKVTVRTEMEACTRAAVDEQTKTSIQ